MRHEIHTTWKLESQVYWFCSQYKKNISSLHYILYRKKCCDYFTFPCISCYAFSLSVMSELHVTGTVSVCSHLRCLWPNLVPLGSPASAAAKWL